MSVKNENDTLDEKQDYLEMSDEDFINAPLPVETTDTEVEKVDENENTDTDTSDEESTTDVSDETTDENSNDDGDSDTDTISDDSDGVDEDNNTDDVFTEKEDTEETDEKEESEASSETDKATVDYKAAYEAIFGKPFKANGREMTVKTPEEVIQLMQMGANYNLKMNAIKENIPYIKMLEKNDLLNTDKLSTLIEIDKGNKDAIAQLIKKHDIDAYSLNTEDSEKYSAPNHAIPAKQLELEAVVEELQETSPVYDKTVGIVQGWDTGSREAIGKNPAMLRTLAQHIEMGMYDVVADEVSRLEALGQLKGISQIQAYEQVGEWMAKQGALDKFLGTPEPTHSDATQKVNEAKAKARLEQDKLRDKKKSVSSAKTVTTNKAKPVIDIFNLSDEEFNKLGDPRFT